MKRSGIIEVERCTKTLSTYYGKMKVTINNDGYNMPITLKCKTFENPEHIILPGIYRLRNTYKQKDKKFIIEIEELHKPLFKAGNTGQDSKGEIIPSEYCNNEKAVNSMNTINLIMELCAKCDRMILYIK